MLDQVAQVSGCGIHLFPICYIFCTRMDQEHIRQEHIRQELGQPIRFLNVKIESGDGQSEWPSCGRSLTTAQDMPLWGSSNRRFEGYPRENRVGGQHRFGRFGVVFQLSQ